MRAEDRYEGYGIRAIGKFYQKNAKPMSMWKPWKKCVDKNTKKSTKPIISMREQVHTLSPWSHLPQLLLLDNAVEQGIM